MGSAKTVANKGLKAVDCWSGGKNTKLQPMIAFPIDGPKTTDAIKRQEKKLFLIYVECFELSVEYFGKIATFF